MQAARKPVRERLGAGELALGVGLPALRDGDGLVATPHTASASAIATAAPTRAGFRRVRGGLDRSGQRQRRARIALREGEARTQRDELHGTAGREGEQDGVGLRGTVQRPEEVAGPQPGERDRGGG